MNPLKAVTQFVGGNFGWTLNFLFSWLLFGLYAAPLWASAGYVNTYSRSGNIPSGPYGSGVVPVCFMLVCVSSAMMAILIWNWKPAKPGTGSIPNPRNLSGFGAGSTPFDSENDGRKSTVGGPPQDTKNKSLRRIDSKEIS
ncbi:hypothetical protein TrLO_g9263 [Triparma laevis f. longispina]|uniref:Uncharacterized protein n=1 Tax=Triparma laevis f. longispina TaxID=1714387 RepID=A0A9W7KYG0_9STRA|nr:hypothetical protein TrLO_g9263 [Triparma laevis f. longispina]